MNCKECRHWFVNPNIVIPGEPTEGKCLVSEIKTQSNQVCNAWELSRIAELKDDNEKLTARIAELEAENEKINYFFRRLRMFCIFAHWDNPNTEAEFYKVDAEIREHLSEYKVCDQRC